MDTNETKNAASESLVAFQEIVRQFSESPKSPLDEKAATEYLEMTVVDLSRLRENGRLSGEWAGSRHGQFQRENLDA